MPLTILYRGPLASCDYDCGYCPFAKRRDSAEQLRRDRHALQRFVAWCEQADRPLRVLFTPWGEAAIRSWYRNALATLSRMPHVAKAAVQTNLSVPLDWLDRCDIARIGLWCTYHPSQTTRQRFLEQARRLRESGVSHSVGMVGLREDFEEIETMRRLLPAETYLWINASKRDPDYYCEKDVRRLTAVDPLFPVNLRPHPSRGRACLTGERVIAVDGEGVIRRCHFVDRPLGRLYDDGWESALGPAPCPNATCGCHIGYIHLPHLRQYPLYGDGLLERHALLHALTPAD